MFFRKRSTRSSITSTLLVGVGFLAAAVYGADVPISDLTHFLLILLILLAVIIFAAVIFLGLFKFVTYMLRRCKRE